MPTQDEQPTTQQSSEESSVTFHYIKSSDFRTVHVDGAIGGLTTKGFLHFSVYNERAAIPQETTHNILPNGLLGDEIPDQRKSKEGIVRQMEIDLIMNEETARELSNWLNQALDDFEERKKIIDDRRKTSASK